MLSFAQTIDQSIADEFAALLAECDMKATVFPLAYEIEDIRDRDATVDDRAARGDFRGLRRSKNGRTLLALWKVRAAWNDSRPLTVDDIVPGYSPDPAQRDLEMRLGMEDEAFRYTFRTEPLDRWEGEYAGYESQDAFVRAITETRRQELVAALQDFYGDAWNSAQVVAWVKSRIERKHGNLLRGYCSALYSIKYQARQRDFTTKGSAPESSALVMQDA